MMRFHSISYLSPFSRSLEQLLGELVVHFIGNCEQLKLPFDPAFGPPAKSLALKCGLHSILRMYYPDKRETH